LPDLDNRGACLVEHDPVANHGNADALIVISRGIRRIDPLPFRDSLIGTASEQGSQIVQELAQLPAGHFLAVVESQGN